MSKVAGIHHVTAISSNPLTSVSFFAGLLGLRLVKRTVNYDDPYTYQLFFGDPAGSPGSLISFYPWSNIREKGTPGTGQVSAVSFSIPPDSISYWTQRFREYNVRCSEPFPRFGEEVIEFRDPDGLKLEFVATHDDRATWQKGTVAADKAVRGLHGVTLLLEGFESTDRLMTSELGFASVRENGNRYRYSSGDGGPGTIVDILCQPTAQPGEPGAGTVHHVAWRVTDDDTQLNILQKLVQTGHNITPILDRHYFKSVYFRESSRVLFEIATDRPGLTQDEDLDFLGTALRLPKWLENRRGEIEQSLPPIQVPGPRG